MLSQVKRYRWHTLALFLALALLLTVALPALASTRLETGGQVPFYARFGTNETFHDGQWAVIVFYRPPGCIPAGFNLMHFFDFPGPTGPGAFGCNPPTTDSFEIWENGPGVDAGPYQAVLHGRGAVPVWFVAWAELEPAMADGEVTIGELAGLPSLRTGTASNYHEMLQPSQAAKNPMLTFSGSGALDDGGSFAIHAVKNTAAGQGLVQIRLD
jgi:hypothetical protein